ncbi:MAG: tRNA lysidine(34) synthetase TilS [Candidatus Edwardsbacteria bacterium]
MEEKILSKVRNTIKGHKMLQGGERVIVAVSGGPDSVALLYILLELKQEYKLQLHLAHLNHKLRGKKSEEDAEFVTQLAQRLNLPLSIESFEVATFLKQEKLSLQEVARHIRYHFLENVAKENEADRIATGHTANDQAETILLRLIRGAGTCGLGGIPYVREKVIRPLLEIEKEEILNYLNKTNIPYRIDHSNFESIYSRNKLRKEVLPLLQKEFNPKIVETLARTAAILQEENSVLQIVANFLFDKIKKYADDSKIILDFREFLDYNKVLRRIVLREAIKNYRGNLRQITRRQIDTIIENLEKDKPSMLCDWLSSLTVSKIGEEIVIANRRRGVFQAGKTEKAQRPDWEVTLDIPGVNEISQGRIITKIIKREDAPLAFWAKEKNEAYFDYAQLKLPLKLRNRRKGDILKPLGMQGESKKVKEILIEAKIPRGLRDEIPLLLSGEEILWIPEVKQSEIAKIREDTKKVLKVQFSETRHISSEEEDV